jgi:hypothetical protein
MLHANTVNLVVSRTVWVESWKRVFVSKSGLSCWLFRSLGSFAVVLPFSPAWTVVFQPDGSRSVAIRHEVSFDANKFYAT